MRFTGHDILRSGVVHIVSVMLAMCSRASEICKFLRPVSIEKLKGAHHDNTGFCQPLYTADTNSCPEQSVSC